MHPRGPRSLGKIERAKDPRSALLRLIPYLSHFKAGLVLAFVFVLVYIVLGLIPPYLIKLAIDRDIPNKDLSGLAKIALLMLAVYLFNNLFQAVANWIMAGISQRALKQIRKDLFQHLQTLPLRFFDHNPAGELMSRLTNDIDAINQSVSQNVTSLIASVLSMVGILVAMFIMDKWLASTSFLVVPIMLNLWQVIRVKDTRNYRNTWEN
jgi:ATP-binding cassette subfamily B protein